MFTSLLGARDQLTLSNAEIYLTQSNIDPFVYFANNVIIKQEMSFSEQSAMERVTEAIQKAYNNFGIKLMAPLKTLALKVLEGNYGFIQLHTAFLRLCAHQCMPSEALPIIEYPGLFKHMRKADQMDFLIEACDICLMLRKFPQAYEFASKACKLQSRRQERTAGAFRKLYILTLCLKKSLKDLNEPAQKIQASLQVAITEIQNSFSTPSKKEQQIQKYQIELYLLRLYLGFKEWKQLKPDQQKLLAKDNLLQAFNESQYTGLRSYIESEIKGLNWRIKATDIKNINVGKFQVIRGINNSKQIYKYDCQEKTMYFNHKQCDQEQLNQLISKAFLMQNQINNCKLERKESDFGGRLGGMGFGGFGGFGGMGMGGMSFGGMGMGGSKKRRPHGHMGGAFGMDDDDDE